MLVVVGVNLLKSKPPSLVQVPVERNGVVVEEERVSREDLLDLLLADMANKKLNTINKNRALVD